MPIGRRDPPIHWLRRTGSCASTPPSRHAMAGSLTLTHTATRCGTACSMQPTRSPGDYLVQAGTIWFIAAQQRLAPVLCVQANRIVSFWRPAAPSNTGVNTYGGVITETNEALLANWPASILGAAGRGHPNADLPSDSSIPYWTVLLPAIPGVILRPSDLMTDDLGRNAVVAAAELTDLGWRITVKQATT